jgi:hypothetical protein
LYYRLNDNLLQNTLIFCVTYGKCLLDLFEAFYKCFYLSPYNSGVEFGGLVLVQHWAWFKYYIGGFTDACNGRFETEVEEFECLLQRRVGDNRNWVRWKGACLIAIKRERERRAELVLTEGLRAGPHQRAYKRRW